MVVSKSRNSFSCFILFVNMIVMWPVEVLSDDLKYQPINVVPVEKCPGRYCGRTFIEGECGACPRGYRPNLLSSWSECVECQETLSTHDWLYLGFMALLSLVLHWFFIDYKTRGKKFGTVLALHVSALVESGVSAVLTLLLVDPIGSLHIRSCKIINLSDWYTMLYNPSPNYTTTLHCTQEVVYPLYTMVMIYYAISLVMLMLVRPIISYKFVESRGSKSIYAALYFLPILIVCQAILGGALYYAFSYIILGGSVVSIAVHLASLKDQGMKDLIIDSFTNGRNATILIGHWLIHAYGIVSLTLMEDPGLQAPLLALVAFPAIFYVLTVKFSDPDNLERT